MRFKLLISILIVILAGSIFTANAASGQSLVVGEYKDDIQLKMVFKECAGVLEYFRKGRDAEKQVYIALCSDDGIKNLAKSEMNTKIIEENANLSSFRLYYHPLEGQSKRLEEYGQTYEILAHYTLLKAENPTVLAETGGVVAEFFQVPIKTPVVTPTYPNQELTQKNSENKKTTTTTIIIVGLVLFVILLFIIGGIYYLKKRKINSP